MITKLLFLWANLLEETGQTRVDLLIEGILKIGTIYEAYLFNTEFKDHQLQKGLPIVGIVSL